MQEMVKRFSFLDKPRRIRLTLHSRLFSRTNLLAVSLLGAMHAPAARAVTTCSRTVVVSGAGSSVVNGAYVSRPAEVIPASFTLVCRQSKWDATAMWQKLNRGAPWWETENGSYFYLNKGDGKWWLDSGVTGLGLYISSAAGAGEDVPPTTGWLQIGDGELPLPTLRLE
jgi:hypothetical protein